MPRLLVVLLEPLTDLIEKGEVVARYYNPGEVFDEIDFLLLNDDRPDADAVGAMCGRARTTIHHLPLPRGVFARAFAWNDALLRPILDAAAAKVAHTDPALVRTYGAGLNGLVANHIGRRLNVPVLLSLHNRPDHIVATGWKDWARQYAQQRLAARVLRGADNVMAVYRAQLPYLRGLGVDAKLAYNIIGSAGMPVKSSFRTGNPFRILSVGRQFQGKDVTNVIRAVGRLPDVHFTVVGDGPLHDHLVSLAESQGLGERTTFFRSIANPELCASLHTYDVFVSHNEHPGIPKAVMEPMLAGLPVVMNHQPDGADAELRAAAILVANTVETYADAISRLAVDENLRRSVGEACRQRALETWEPSRSERCQAEIAAALLATSRPVPAVAKAT
jgi:glycosyltransferase involved in cell wall biosynthesis